MKHSHKCAEGYVATGFYKVNILWFKPHLKFTTLGSILIVEVGINEDPLSELPLK